MLCEQAAQALFTAHLFLFGGCVFMKKNMKGFIRVSVCFALALMLSVASAGCKTYVPQNGELPDGYQPNPTGKIKLQYFIANTDADKRSVNDWVASFTRKYPANRTNFFITSNYGIHFSIFNTLSNISSVFF